MSWLDYFRASQRNSARTAKERLQVIIAHERRGAGGPAYLPRLRRDILEVIKRYAPVSEDQISIQVEQDNGCEVLELNITLPDGPQALR